MARLQDPKRFRQLEVLARIQGVEEHQARVDRLRRDPVGQVGEHRRRGGSGMRFAEAEDHHPGVVDAPGKQPEQERAEDAGHRAARHHGEQNREGVEDRELKEQERHAAPVKEVPHAGAKPQRQPGRGDEEDDPAADERDDPQILADQQLPARRRLREKNRGGARLEKRRREAGRPDQGEQHAEGAGGSACQDQLQEADRIDPFAGHRDRDDAEAERHAAGERVDTVGPGELGTRFEPRLATCDGERGGLQRIRAAERGHDRRNDDARIRRRQKQRRSVAAMKLHVAGDVHAGAEEHAHRGQRQHHPADARRLGLAKRVPDELPERGEKGWLHVREPSVELPR